MHARLFSARVYLSYETSLELVSHKLSRKLVSEIRHFSHPRWLLLLLFSSLLSTSFLYLPSSYTPPPSWYPLFYEKLAPDKRSVDEEDRATGKSRVLSISVPSIRSSGRITPQLPRFALSAVPPAPSSFLSSRYHGKRRQPRTTREGFRVGRSEENRMDTTPLFSPRVFFAFCFLPVARPFRFLRVSSIRSSSERRKSRCNRSSRARTW